MSCFFTIIIFYKEIFLLAILQTHLSEEIDGKLPLKKEKNIYTVYTRIYLCVPICTHMCTQMYCYISVLISIEM